MKKVQLITQSIVITTCECYAENVRNGNLVCALWLIGETKNNNETVKHLSIK